MSEKGNGWIYVNPYPEYEELFKRIEAALGFKLFTWQKSFIVLGHFRRYGETTAMILKELLDTEAAPLDYTRRGMSHREDFYRRELRGIQERLEDAGIKTRVVFWSVEDKQRYRESYKGTCEKRDCRRCPFPPCRKGESRHDYFLMVIVIMVLLDIDGRLIKMNERQGKEDAGNND